MILYLIMRCIKSIRFTNLKNTPFATSKTGRKRGNS